MKLFSKIMKTIVPSNLVAYQEARDRVNRGEADDIAYAYRAIAIEKIRDGEVEADGIVAPLKKALALETEARRKLETAEQVRQEADRIQREWESRISDCETVQKRLTTAEERINITLESAKNVEQWVHGALGNPHEEKSIWEPAIQVATVRLALPIMEQALQAIRNELVAHIRKIHEFGKENGIPKDVLASLPND
jgi:hypothetical protein